MTQLFLGVFLFELVNTTRGVYQHVLTRKERVRRIGDLELDERILIAIFPFDGLFGRGRRTAQEGVAIAHVLENNQAVAFGVKSFFHNNMIFKALRILP